MFRKTNISYLLIHWTTSTNQGVNVSFFKKFYVRGKWMISTIIKLENKSPNKPQQQKKNWKNTHLTNSSSSLNSFQNLHQKLISV